MSNERHGLASADATSSQFGNDSDPAAMKALALRGEANALQEAVPAFGSPSTGMESIGSVPRIDFSLFYKFYDERGNCWVKGSSVSFPRFRAKRDQAPIQIDIIAQVYPCLCDATALMSSNLEGGVQHLPDKLRSHLWNFLSDQCNVRSTEFGLRFRIVLADTKTNTWVRLYESPMESFLHNH